MKRIDVIINLLGETYKFGPSSWPPLKDKIEEIPFEIEDYRVPSNETKFKNLLYVILQKLKQGLNVSIHCWGGRGRTCLVVGCLYTMIYPRKDFKTIIKELREINSYYIESQSQLEYVKNFSTLN